MQNNVHAFIGPSANSAQRELVPTTAIQRRRAHWASIPFETIEGDSDAIRSRLPAFKRWDTASLGLCANPHYDLIARVPKPPFNKPVPVSLISKTYRLIQHEDVLNAAIAHLKILVQDQPVALVSTDLTEAGERVMFRFDLGPAFSICPDGELVSLHLLVWNSVDGSTAIRAQLGWFRAVCANGLIVGVSLGRTRVPHNPEADLSAVFRPLSQGLILAKREAHTLCNWVTMKISTNALGSWVDKIVAKDWGVLAAARIWEICQSGYDCELIPPFESVPARVRARRRTISVPGSARPADNVYAVTQALSWVASNCNNLEDRLIRQKSIGSLLRPLLQQISRREKSATQHEATNDGFITL
jgi:hypothetical protein